MPEFVGYIIFKRITIRELLSGLTLKDKVPVKQYLTDLFKNPEFKINTMKKRLIKISTLIAILVSVWFTPAVSQVLNEGTFKIGRTFGLIDAWYVDSVNMDELTEKAIVEVLRNLDPHSVYISAKDVKEMNEPLNGNFDGIGIQFNLLHDSIIVVEPIAGGPSEKAGLRAGDRIIEIDGENVAGKGISTAGVRTRLMGMRGTKVIIRIFRKGEPGILDFTLTRDRIPINSLDAAYMLDDETGYIRLNKFAATTDREFTDAVENMGRNKMKNLVLDLRGNGGGIMAASTSLLEKFFSDKKLMVYLEGRKTPRQDYTSGGEGSLASARIAVLVDEGSASASEIIAGALQDWDRGLIIGRPTFGKGLVQHGYYLTDGSMIRLTVARYYTPTGRSIQSPYDQGYDKYMENYYIRLSNGGLLTGDTIALPDSLSFKTLVSKRTVYGGGGIMPDVFVPVDTSGYSDYYRNLVRRGAINSFALEFFDQNRNRLTSEYRQFEDFRKKFAFSEKDIADFIKEGEKAGVKYNEEEFNISRKEILTVLKAVVATNMWQTNEYFRIVNEDDKVIEKALGLISDPAAYNRILGGSQNRPGL